MCKENLTLEYKIKKEKETHLSYVKKWSPILQIMTGENKKLGKATLEIEKATPTSQTKKTLTYIVMRN
jgi:hypothetical protein